MQRGPLPKGEKKGKSAISVCKKAQKDWKIYLKAVKMLKNDEPLWLNERQCHFNSACNPVHLLTVSSQRSLPTKLIKFKKVVLKTLGNPSPPKTELAELVERFITCLFSLICQIIWTFSSQLPVYRHVFIAWLLAPTRILPKPVS